MAIERSKHVTPFSMGPQRRSQAMATGASGISPAAAQADSTATTVAGIVADFNALLAKLRASGQMLP